MVGKHGLLAVLARYPNGKGGEGGGGGGRRARNSPARALLQYEGDFAVLLLSIASLRFDPGTFSSFFAADRHDLRGGGSNLDSVGAVPEEGDDEDG